MSEDFDFPVVVTADGLQPQDPALIQQQLLAKVAVTNPGYTANLPGILIDDISGTDVAAISLIDQGKVDLVNSLTPNGANQFLLGQLGTIYIGEGQPGKPTNTSVPVVFQGTVGYVIPQGILIGDGSGHAFQVQPSPNGVISSGGSSGVLTAISVQPGSFGVPANTANRVLTSVPASVSLTVNNPTDGTPGGAAETWSSFRARVLQAGQAACVGGPRLIKTLIGRVDGVHPNLISVVPVTGGLKVIVGGGDAYQVASAILQGVGDPTRLVGSATTIRNINVVLIDPPNTYPVVFVNPPEQTVTMTITWNTTFSGFTGGGAFPSLVQAPLVAYINSIAVGQPINVLEMNEIFQQAVADVLDPDFLTRLVFAVSINGTPTAPGSGTYAISGDPESYFFTALDGSGITVTQG